MIENKLIAIRKKTTFDKGWTLVAPYHNVFLRNRQFRALNVSDIVRAITKSTQVNLILSESCLSSQIVKELEWVNKYITINLIAKSQNVVNCYAQLKFNNIEIDNGIDFNYIAIKGNTCLYAFIAESYIFADLSINKVYFEKAKVNTEYVFLNRAKQVIFVDENNDKDYAKLFDACLKAKIPTAYLVGVKAYKQELVNKFLNLNATLLCSENVKNGVLYSTNDGRIYCVNLTNKGVVVSSEIENATYYIGQPFASLKCADVIDVNKIPQDSYICDSGSITPLKIVKEKTIERTVQMPTMEDFVSEQFDKSETKKHNQYCSEVEEVIYRFTLIPPIFNTNKISDIYDVVNAVYAKWQENIKAVNLADMIGFLNDLELSESGLCLLCGEIVGFNKRLNDIVKKHNYKNYYVDLKNLDELVNYASIDDYCKELVSKLNAESSETKFDKFDKEIAGYRQTIEEKNALIAQKIEVLSNKRRVEILEKKIADLLAMKQRFSGSSSVRDSKQIDAFLTVCRQVIDGKFVEEKRETDSIGNVLATKEISKISKLELFIKTYLYDFNKFIATVKELLKKFVSIDIPTDYVVYEQNEKRVIAIESEQEYYDTEDIRNHFNLYCRARR